MFSINSEQLPHLTRIIISVGGVFVGRRRICGIICGIIIVVGCWVLSSIILYDLSYRMSAINILIDGGRSGIISFMYSRVLWSFWMMRYFEYFHQLSLLHNARYLRVLLVVVTSNKPRHLHFLTFINGRRWSDNDNVTCMDYKAKAFRKIQCDAVYEGLCYALTTQLHQHYNLQPTTYNHWRQIHKPQHRTYNLLQPTTHLL